MLSTHDKSVGLQLITASIHADSLIAVLGSSCIFQLTVLNVCFTCCIFNAGGKLIYLYLGAHKRPQVVEVFGALHYDVPHDHIVVLAHKIPSVANALIVHH